jgi:hypothetical protein
MSAETKPSRVTQVAMTRALKAAKSAGFSVSRFDIGPDGKLSVHIASGEKIEPASTPFDAWKQRQQNARPS